MMPCKKKLCVLSAILLCAGVVWAGAGSDNANPQAKQRPVQSTPTELSAKEAPPVSPGVSLPELRRPKTPTLASGLAVDDPRLEKELDQLEAEAYLFSNVGPEIFQDTGLRACADCLTPNMDLGVIGTDVFGYSQSGNCGTEGKWYASFTGEIGAKYHFDLCPNTPGAGTASSDLDIKITDSACAILGGVDGSCSGGPSSYLPNDYQWTCPAAGTYYVVIAPYRSYNQHNCTGTASNTFTMQYYKEPYVPPCTITCPGGATTEPEACGAHLNDGCNATPNAFTPIAVGETVCGTAYTYSTGSRDTDWYQLTLTEWSEVTWTVTSNFPSAFFIISGACGALTTEAAAYDGSCTGASAVKCLAPGTYYLFVSLGTSSGAIYTGYPCGTANDYVATVSAVPCLPYYCTAGSTYTGCDEYIGAVQVDGNNSQDIYNTNGICSPTPLGYGDYTAMSAEVTIGRTYPITVTAGTSYATDRCAAWIDWNQNFVFEAGEKITFTGSPGVGPYTGSFTVPLTALTGSTRLRVRMNYNADPPTCGTTTYGETEDYTIDIKEPPPEGACCDGATCYITDGDTCEYNTHTYHGDGSLCDPNPCVGACCYDDGSCAVSTEAECTGAYAGDGTDCEPNQCPQPGRCCYDPFPNCVEVLEGICTTTYAGIWKADTTCAAPCPMPITMDTCATALDITSVPYVASYDSDLATADGPSCNTYYTVMQNDVWFKYTPTTDCYLTLDVSDVGTGYDMVMAIYTGPDCDNLTLMTGMCFDDPEPYAAAFAATAGTTYWFQQGDYGSTEGGGLTDFSLQCSSGTGACCTGCGDCAVMGIADCAAAGGTFQGDGTTCESNPCPPPVTGNDCCAPISVAVPAALPYTDPNQTTCGRGDDYDNTCLGNYDGGEDIMYELVVTEPTCVSITATGNTSANNWIGLAIDANCPLASSCVAAVGSSGTVATIPGVALMPGTYYVMVDTYPSPDCLTDFTLDIAVSDTCPSGACCFYAGTCDVVFEAQCTGVGDFAGTGTVCGGDCDADGLTDTCAILGGSPDCQPNGIPDYCDLDPAYGGTSVDKDGNGVPDECDPDCNTNGIPDVCDLSCLPGLCYLVPTCGSSADCQPDGTPDECQLGGGTETYQLDDGTHEDSIGLTYGGNVAWMNHFTVTGGAVISKIQIAYGPVADGTALTAYLWSDPNGDGDPTDATVIASAAAVTANGDLDVFNDIEISGAVGSSFFAGAIIAHLEDELPAAIDTSAPHNTSSWIAGDADAPLDPNDLGSAAIPPGLIDDLLPSAAGNWLIRVVAGSGGDCNNNGIPDDCDIAAGAEDCQPDGIPDDCQIADNDCNNNGKPDDCELEGNDCNANLVPDDCDIAAGAADCQPDGIPDDCQLGEPGGGNIVADPSFEAGTASPDWIASSTNYGTPLCDSACGTGGGTAAPYDGVVWAWFGGCGSDCTLPEVGTLEQTVTIPVMAEAHLTFWFWIGASGGAGADEFTVQIDGNVVFDVFDDDATYAAGYTQVDIDITAYADGGNHVLLFTGTQTTSTSTNFEVDLVEIQTPVTPPTNDCNGDTVPDDCDIQYGTSEDCDNNGKPDECQICGDLDGDGDVDSADYAKFRQAFGRSVGQPGYNPCVDYDGSGKVGLADYQQWLACYRAFIGNPLALPPPLPRPVQVGQGGATSVGASAATASQTGHTSPDGRR